MRVLTIVAGLVFALAGVCPAQTEQPQPPQDPAPSNPALHEKLEEFKAQYGKAQLSSNSVTEVVLKPKPGLRSIEVNGDARAVYNRIASEFGVRASFDESIASKFVKLSLQNVDFDAAMVTAGLMTHTFWVPVTNDEFLVATDTAQKRREISPMLERTFYLPDATAAADLQDITNLLRTIFEVRYVVQQPGTSSITVRAEQNTMHQIEQLLAGLDTSRPQVMLEIQAIEVDSTMQRQLGINLPLQFQMFNIPSAVKDLLNTPGIQNLLQQLAQSGGLSNALSSSTVGALLGQYQNQLQALLANPVATFGGGLTFMALSIPPTTVTASLNESKARMLQQVTLQASQGNPATLHIGNRFPIVTQTFSSGVNVAGLNLGVAGAIPGFTYEDLGVTLKAKPTIHGSTAVTLDTELSIKALGTQVINRNPVIQNREYKGTITVKDGEPAVIAGMISKSEIRSLSGPPGIGSLPVLNRILSSESKSEDSSELVLIITPHITRVRQAETPLIAVE